VLRQAAANRSLQRLRLVAVIAIVQTLRFARRSHLLGCTLWLAGLGSAAVCIHAAVAATVAVCSAVILHKPKAGSLKIIANHKAASFWAVSVCTYVFKPGTPTTALHLMR
jgi:hypothetical protein